DYELKIIRQMGYSGYFLIVWDLVNFARQKRIPVGPGRGSAAGSLVAYVLGITNINPLQYDLLFERFLNPERVTMPDIDIDFCFERRGEIIEYVSRKYGSDRVAQIITFGTMAAKAAIRDVGRVMNFSYQEADRIAKLVPNELGVTIDRALQLSPELKELYERDERIKQLLDTARALEGMPRHASTHAAGIVIAKEPLTCYLPLQKTSEGMVTTQFPMQTVEEIGLLKMDILGLRTLTVIGDTLRLVEKTRKISLDIDQIPLDDEKTYSLLSRGETIGVFQLESSGMRNILRNLKPERFEDIIALVALYRPGPLGSGMVDDFINRKHGKVPVEYLHPLLKPILEETYGVILYQEQVMRIASEMAGFTLGQADLLRRAMGKKKPEVLAAQRENFLQGAEKRGVDRKTAEKIFELMAHFAGYGFNKSHSAAYAYIAYQTAYLKANYPVEYMASLLTSIMENSDKVPVYIEECRRMGIEILPPDVNESLVDFTVVNNKIRFGLAAVKNVGKNAIQAIISARNSGGPFKTLTDFCQRVDLRQVNRRVIESLIRCGAFNSLGVRRSQLLAILERCLETAQQVQRDRNSGQMSLIDLVDGEETETSLETIPDIPEFSRREILAMEKEMLGFYVSGHPLAEYQEQLKRFATHSVADLESLSDETAVKIGGILTGVRKTVTRKGEVMAYLQLEDTTGRVEVLIFPRVYSRFSRILQEDTIVVVEGKVSKRDEELKVFGELVKTLPSSPNPPKIYIRLEQAEAVHIEKLKKVLMQYRGNSPVYLYFPRQNKCILINNRYWVDPHPKLEQEVEQILGKGNLKIVQPGG
ncbi:DNA polymerase III subunit alpha, partial [Calderihabitans maritimus]